MKWRNADSEAERRLKERIDGVVKKGAWKTGGQNCRSVVEIWPALSSGQYFLQLRQTMCSRAWGCTRWEQLDWESDGLLETDQHRQGERYAYTNIGGQASYLRHILKTQRTTWMQFPHTHASQHGTGLWLIALSGLLTPRKYHLLYVKQLGEG